MTARRRTRRRVDRVGPLRRRLEAVTTALDISVTSDSTGMDADDAARSGDLLDALVTRHDGTDRWAWLLLVTVAGTLPEAEDVRATRRDLALAGHSAEAAGAVLRRGAELLRDRGDLDRDLELVIGGVILDVDHAARRNRHTGIQRVTREVAAAWARDHEIHLAVWDESEHALRAPARHEADRVLRWSGPYEETPGDVAAAATAPLVVPWDSVVVLPEVAQGRTARPLAALAELSGNRVVAIGYDAIPVTSADMRPAGEANMYVRYLDVIKHCHRVAGISSSATAEFLGFSQAIRAQGMTGPDVVEVSLAAEVGPSADTLPTVSSRPEVLVVASQEIHKNHAAVLHAAELLWREGLDFELVLVGGPGSASPVLDAVLTDLNRHHRPIRRLGNVTDEELWAAYRSARFSVFPSLHEGFGLPVAESLACGTPAVTTRYGSTEEIARRGGCLLVDPRDDGDLAAAMRRLLTDDGEHARLAAEAAAAPVRTWEQYATDLWDALITDLLTEGNG